MDLKLEGKQNQVVDYDCEKIREYRRSIRAFVFDMWGLSPQPIKPAYEKQWDAVCACTHAEWEAAKTQVQPDWFGDYDETLSEWVWYSPDGDLRGRDAFVAANYFTWQQNLILIGIEKSIRKQASNKISVVSGHGIGKSATCAWIVLWFLQCFFESQVPVTAPTSAQMHDVLWKEMSLWIGRMKSDDSRALYQWQRDYIRMTYKPNEWFARARTSTKENTEAIAGVHAEYVAIVIDEASGVPQPVFTAAKGALTSGNVLLVMISNGTRTTGEFYDSQHNSKAGYQLFQFNGEHSPVVDKAYIEDMATTYGEDSEEYIVRVKGGFPDEDSMDDDGYLQLIPETKIQVRLRGITEVPFIGRRILGVDPSGEGKDKATFVVRDRFKADLVHSRKTTNDKEIAEDILTLMDKYHIAPEDVVLGAFGSGADTGKEIAIATGATKTPLDIYTVMEGRTPEAEEHYNWKFFRREPDELQNPEGKTDELVDLYLNIRALMYFRARKWLLQGGQICDVSVQASAFAGELVSQKYKRSLHGNKIQLMSKKERMKLRLPSPNISDAFALTFLRSMNEQGETIVERMAREAEARDSMPADDRFNAL